MKQLYNGIKSHNIPNATCPELNFVSSFGDTKQEAINNLEDVIKLMIEPISDDLFPESSSLEQVELVL